MTITGNLEKMTTKIGEKVTYFLPVGDKEIELNQYIGKTISLLYNQQINCVSCGCITKNSFGQGFCYHCFTTAPESSECILHPDKCQAHLGITRDIEWSVNHCLTPHIVYLSVSSNLKVGITRKSQIPTRWIDQGATQAIVLAETPNRHIAGVIEKYLMQYYSDKTSWQTMLKGDNNSVNLYVEKDKVINLLPNEIKRYITEENNITQINYPVLNYPQKVQSLSFDKTNRIEGVLTGIKGQYLIFDNSSVLNIRKHRGYQITLNQ